MNIMCENIYINKNSVAVDTLVWVKNEDYNSIIGVLEAKKRNNTLLPNERNILAICKTIVNLDENGIIPISLRLMPAETFVEAINDCEYEVALKFHNQRYQYQIFQDLV